MASCNAKNLLFETFGSEFKTFRLLIQLVINRRASSNLESRYIKFGGTFLMKHQIMFEHISHELAG
jgi:hypothetical protein